MTSARVELLAAKLQRMEQLVAFDFAEEITDFTVVELLELSARMDLIFPVVKLGYRRSASRDVRRASEPWTKPAPELITVR